MQKTCFKCKRQLPIEQFYAHPRMADGHLNKCRECTRCDTRQNRRRKADYYRSYDRERAVLPHRIAARDAYNAAQNGGEPRKRAARTMAGNALRDGRLSREPCYFCGSQSGLEMHHPDYSQPLRIYWLCRQCHRKLDGMTKLGMEAAHDDE